MKEDSMNFDFKAILSFVKEHRIPFIVGGAAALLSVVALISFGVAKGRVKKQEALQASREAYYAETLKEQAKIDERLLSRGQILTTKDNTSPNVIRMYSRKAERGIEIEESVFSNFAFEEETPVVKSETGALEYEALTNDGVTRGQAQKRFAEQPEDFYEPTLP